MKTHWKKTTNPDYLGSWDFQPDEKKTVTIKSVSVRKVKDPTGEDQSCNVAVVDKCKPMILNATACKQLRKFTGSSYLEDWNNVPVTLYVDKVKAFGEVVDAVRISPVQPKPANAKKEKLTPDHSDWEKAIAYMLKEGSDIKNITKKYEIDDTFTNEVSRRSAK